MSGSRFWSSEDIAGIIGPDTAYAAVDNVLLTGGAGVQTVLDWLHGLDVDQYRAVQIVLQAYYSATPTGVGAAAYGLFNLQRSGAGVVIAPVAPFPDVNDMPAGIVSSLSIVGTDTLRISANPGAANARMSVTIRAERRIASV